MRIDVTALQSAPEARLRVERLPIASLVLDPANARQHPEPNLEAIRGSLRRFGQQKPIVVGSDGVVIAGNGTLLAARAEGWDSLEVVRSDLVGADATAFAIADNRTAELADWDDATLARLLESLPTLDGTGYGDDDVKKLLFEIDPHFDPGSFDDQGSLDARKQIKCPECGHEFTPA